MHDSKDNPKASPPRGSEIPVPDPDLDLQSLTSPPALPDSQNDHIFLSIKRKPTMHECVICKRIICMSSLQFRVQTSNSRLAPMYQKSACKFKMRGDCSHVFHSQCLNSFLSEPSEHLDELLDCKACQDLRNFSKHMAWDAVQAEAAIDRIGK